MRALWCRALNTDGRLPAAGVTHTGTAYIYICIYIAYGLCYSRINSFTARIFNLDARNIPNANVRASDQNHCLCVTCVRTMTAASAREFCLLRFGTCS